MSLYTAGIGSEPSIKQITVKEWETENAALQKVLKERVKTFPKKFTWKEASHAFDVASQWGKKMLAKYGGNTWHDLIGKPIDRKGLQDAVNTADNQFQYWLNKAPLPFIGKPAYVYEQGKNKEWQEVYNQVMRVYIEAAGLIGQRIVLNEAQRELAHDLNPVAPQNLLKIVLIAGGIAGGIVYILKSGNNRSY